MYFCCFIPYLFLTLLFDEQISPSHQCFPDIPIFADLNNSTISEIVYPLAISVCPPSFVLFSSFTWPLWLTGMSIFLYCLQQLVLVGQPYKYFEGLNSCESFPCHSLLRESCLSDPELHIVLNPYFAFYQFLFALIHLEILFAYILLVMTSISQSVLTRPPASESPK